MKKIPEFHDVYEVVKFVFTECEEATKVDTNMKEVADLLKMDENDVDQIISRFKFDVGEAAKRENEWSDMSLCINAFYRHLMEGIISSALCLNLLYFNTDKKSLIERELKDFCDNFQPTETHKRNAA